MKLLHKSTKYTKHMPPFQREKKVKKKNNPDLDEEKELQIYLLNQHFEIIYDNEHNLQ